MKEVDSFLHYLKEELNYSEYTIKNYQLDLTDFFKYVNASNIDFLNIENIHVRGYLKRKSFRN